MQPIKLGVIGLGRMGRQHCRIYSNLRRAQLVAVHDLDARVGEQIAREYHAPYTADVDELLRQVEAVSIATPTPSHFDLAMRCLDQGVHVLIEKPITSTLEQARQLVAAAARSGLMVQVGHIERFNPAYAELRNVLEDTTVLAVNVRRLSAYQGSNRDVDVVLDLMIHDLDLVLDLFGQPPAALDAYGLSVAEGVVDHVVAHLNYPSGPLVTLTASRVTEQKVRSIEVTAADSYLECDLLSKNIAVHRSAFGEYVNNRQRGVKFRQESIVERIHVPPFEPLFLELQHFLDCLTAARPALVPASAGLRALELAEAVRASAGARLLVRPLSEFAPGPASLLPVAARS
jgi:predicted dehydrogenase